MTDGMTFDAEHMLDNAACASQHRPMSDDRVLREATLLAAKQFIELTKQLPAFDADVFLEITGIDLREPKKASCEGREIEINGVTYVLKEKK